MRGSVGRRISSGLFLVWFAVFGLTRGLTGVCPQHGSQHAATRQTAAPGLTQTAGHHHAGIDAGAAGSGTHASVSLDAASQGDEGTPAPHGCDCRGECCCCATPQLGVGDTEVVMLEARIATPRRQTTSADRPTHRVHFALPFPTAPPGADAA